MLSRSLGFRAYATLGNPWPVRVMVPFGKEVAVYLADKKKIVIEAAK